MNASSPKPKRPLKNDLYSLAVVLIVPLSVMLAFPYSAIGFSAARREKSPASCAFVTLSGEAEEMAIEAARSAWKGGLAKGRDDLPELGLLAPTLPKADFGPLVSMGDMPPPEAHRTVQYDSLPMPPSLAAKGAQKLSSPKSAEDDAMPFPKGEMLKIDFQQ